ncbi:LamG domain-containing protein [Verminephrobacter eiseniae]|uniref:LamG domain-containing protein n=3 Tax=Verminephrobacter eiseniae TaxID=364317 RepID=UPI0010EEA6A6|nr:LamG domain-containing protein [Verminephrobacter eiseniae]KAB7632897.1 LamG domain-containing protein [Verminephrobacter sp. Larva24]MCW5234427.1 N,N-dimethylformamidase [Verminephrobacter eiseniae]MCW5293997.1 N,N-dimethylformamidase [Verminephrobacter eiseniae]MCW8183265.1 N,N-dimethylformamidase [Verminephrobacter eiseniae]MCW8232800.1 N,N-dimethylformamidase [Verminephrobacter eiseniae]
MLHITAYVDQVSVCPGQTVQLMVHCEYPSYQVEVVKVVHGDTSPAAPQLKILPTDGIRRELPGRPQRILAGSFGLVERMPAWSPGRSLTFQAFICPTTPGKGRQAIISRFDPHTGHGVLLGIDAAGRTLFEVRTAEQTHSVASRRPLLAGQWYFVAGSCDASNGLLSVWQIPLAPIPTLADQDMRQRPCPRPFAGTPGLAAGIPLSLAATWRGQDAGRPCASDHFNGKIDRPRALDAALDLAALRGLQSDAWSDAQKACLIGAWDFSIGMQTDRFYDTSGAGLDGRFVNMPTRAVTGHNFSGEQHCWREQPAQWSAVHFHDDDLHDAGWLVDLAYVVPQALKSGIYAFRLCSHGQEQFVVFVVKPAPGARRAKLLYLFPLATYMAYANEHFGTNDGLVELHLNRALVLHPHQVFLNEHREYGHSLYDLHSDGSGVYYSSRLRPMLNLRPKLESNHGARPSNLWQFNADTHITDWLEHLGLDYDVVTDEDLHQQGNALLAQYQVVMTATHPEYYSTAMWQAVFDFTRSGGRLMYMGGNGFYWRIAFNDTVAGIIETRRAEGGSRAWEPPTGEYYHAFTGEYGGLWRRQGQRAPNHLVGVGFAAQGFDESSPYRRSQASRSDPRVAFAFAGIDDEILGDFGLIGGGAAGMEVDRHDVARGSPRHAVVLASSGPHTEAHVLVVEDMLFNFMGTTGNLCPLVRSDIVFFESGQGGAVFSVGSIAYAGALSHNGYANNISRLTENVLRRFLDARPFPD